MVAVIVLSGPAGMILLGKPETLVSIPVVNGGIIATQIMTQAAMSRGYQLAAALGALILGIQGFFGSFFM